MSATRDKSQKITFVYSNLYAIYRKGVDRAREGATHESGESAPSLAKEAAAGLTRVHVPQAFESGLVIKAKDAKKHDISVPPVPERKVTAYTPAELLGKRIKRPEVLASKDPVASLKQNLATLNDLQARLRFMLKELEDLIKE